MSKYAGAVANLSLGGAAMEDDLTSISFDITQETPDITTFADAGPRAAVGNYGWSFSLDGVADFASGAIDSTVFAQVSGTGSAIVYDPTGVGATGTSSRPLYQETGVLQSYSLKSAVGAATTMSAKFTGNTAITRAVA